LGHGRAPTTTDNQALSVGSWTGTIPSSQIAHGSVTPGTGTLFVGNHLPHVAVENRDLQTVRPPS